MTVTVEPTPHPVSKTSRVVWGMTLRSLLALSMLAVTAVVAYFGDRLHLTGAHILCAMLLVIAFTACTVFWPMIRTVRRETQAFATANARFDQRTSELAATLSELENERDERRARMQEMASMMEDLE